MNESANGGEKTKEPSRKDLGNFQGAFHSGIGSHFRSGGSQYSRTTYDPLKALLPSHLTVWVRHVAKFWFKKKRAFRDYTTPGKGNGVHGIGDKVRLSVIGDWGTGTDEAEMVAEQVREFRPEFTIHLGDVYFVGDETEVKENFLGEKTSDYAPVKWPMGTKGSFALCGNHEMYARGGGYFDAVLPRMGLKRSATSEWGEGQWASFFCLENKHWRIVGIDTGYDSTRFDWGRVPIVQKSKWVRTSEALKPRCELHEKLMKWLATEVNPDGDNRGLILLSHHGPFSSFSDWYRVPSKQLSQLIHRPAIWFWGHEHKLAIYDLYSVTGGIATYGRCIGHGGMPVERGQEPDIDECRWLAWDNRRYHNGEKIDAGFNGYANLILDGADMRVDYRDLRGERLLSEEWRVDLRSGRLEGPRLKKVLQHESLHFREPAPR